MARSRRLLRRRQQTNVLVLRCLSSFDNASLLTAAQASYVCVRRVVQGGHITDHKRRQSAHQLRELFCTVD
jgi:hypothetical protein